MDKGSDSTKRERRENIRENHVHERLRRGRVRERQMDRKLVRERESTCCDDCLHQQGEL